MSTGASTGLGRTGASWSRARSAPPVCSPAGSKRVRTRQGWGVGSTSLAAAAQRAGRATARLAQTDSLLGPPAPFSHPPSHPHPHTSPLLAHLCAVRSTSGCALAGPATMIASRQVSRQASPVQGNTGRGRAARVDLAQVGGAAVQRPPNGQPGTARCTQGRGRLGGGARRDTAKRCQVEGWCGRQAGGAVRPASVACVARQRGAARRQERRARAHPARCSPTSPPPSPSCRASR